MGAFIKELIELMLEYDLLFEFDYDYGWKIHSNRPFDNINLDDIVYKLGIRDSDADNIIKKKMCDYNMLVR